MPVEGYNLAHGLWEAKDTGADFEREIKKKLALGYPPTNLLFQAPGRAVLYQNGQRVLDTPLDDSGQSLRQPRRASRADAGAVTEAGHPGGVTEISQG